MNDYYEYCFINLIKQPKSLWNYYDQEAYNLITPHITESRQQELIKKHKIDGKLFKVLR